jgi:hypothetical protein
MPTLNSTTIPALASVRVRSVATRMRLVCRRGKRAPMANPQTRSPPITAARLAGASVSTANAAAKSTRIVVRAARGKRSARKPAAATPTIPAAP